MKLGLEKKQDRWKAGVLAVLAIGGLWSLYSNVFSDSGSAPESRSSGAASPEGAPGPGGNTAPPPPPHRTIGSRASEFRPKLRGRGQGEGLDLSKVDPTVRLDLLARVQSVSLEGGARNIFQFGAAAPVVPAGPIPKAPKIPLTPVSTQVPPQMPSGPPQPPPPPPIPFKYYGYSSVKGETRKRAFFLDGENIIVAAEGDTIKNRYKVVHVGLNAVEMEDMQFQHKQSLPLAEDLAG